MKTKTSVKFKILDALYIALMIVPFVCAIVMKILLVPASEGLNISGAAVYFAFEKMPLQPLYITEAQVNSWAVILFILGLSLYLTHGLDTVPNLKRQLAAEWIVEKAENLVLDNMGEKYVSFAPFIAGILGLSALSSLSSLLGLFPPTSDINVVFGWSLLVFTLITHYKLKGGVWNYTKGYFEPIPLFAPMNIISEFATPVSMTLRQFGNVLSGAVISTLIHAALGGIANILRVGLPAILSLYFDLFSGCIQAYIFATLTMIYISNGFPEEAYEKRMKRKAERARKKAEAAALATEMEK